MKVSVIVPAYNAGGFIKKCLRGLISQTYPRQDYEVIVVDDGSTDRTAGIVKDFPVRYFFQENSGPAAARNRGAEEAAGEIILFTDADCVPQEDWIEEMVKPFGDPEVMAVKGGYATDQRSLTARFAQVEFEERFEMLKKAETVDMVDTYSAGYRRSVFLSLGGFDPAFPVANNEDTDLSYRMSAAGHKMVFNPDAVVSHLKHSDTLCKYARLKFWRGYWRMVVYRRYPDKMLKDSYTPQTLKLQIVFLFLFLASLSLVWVHPRLFMSLMAAALLLFLVSSLPFAFLALRRDIAVGLLSPFFLFVRAASLGAGTLWAILFSGKQFEGVPLKGR